MVVPNTRYMKRRPTHPGEMLREETSCQIMASPSRHSPRPPASPGSRSTYCCVNVER